MSGVHGLGHLAKRLFPPLVSVWAAAFGFLLWQLGVVLGAHTLGSAVGQVPIGHLSDRGDRRRLLAAGIALIGVDAAAVSAAPLVRGGSVAGFSPTFLALSTATLAAGLGSAFVHPTGYPLISANVPESARGKVLGMWGSAARFGDGLAPAIVGALLLVVAWPAILVGVGGAIVLAAVVLLVALRGFDTAPTARRDRADRDAITRDRRTFVYPFDAVTLYCAELLLFAGVFQLATDELVDRYDPRHVLLVFLAVGAASLGALSAFSLSHVGLVGVLVVLGASIWGLNPARDRLVDAIAPKGGEGKTFDYLNQGESPAVHGGNETRRVSFANQNAERSGDGRESDNCGTTADSAQSGVSSHVHFHSEWRVYAYRRAICLFDKADQHVRCDSEVRRGRGVTSTPVGRFCRPLERNHIRAPRELCCSRR